MRSECITNTENTGINEQGSFSEVTIPYFAVVGFIKGGERSNREGRAEVRGEGEEAVAPESRRFQTPASLLPSSFMPCTVVPLDPHLPHDLVPKDFFSSVLELPLRGHGVTPVFLNQSRFLGVLLDCTDRYGPTACHQRCPVAAEAGRPG